MPIRYGTGYGHITVDHEYHTTTITDGIDVDEGAGQITVDFRELPSLIDALTKIRAELANEQCPYTFAHTRHWCGHAGCRDS